MGDDLVGFGILTFLFQSFLLALFLSLLLLLLFAL